MLRNLSGAERPLVFTTCGGILAGLLADAFNISVAIAVIGLLTFLSGAIVAIVMQETLSSHDEAGNATPPILE